MDEIKVGDIVEVDVCIPYDSIKRCIVWNPATEAENVIDSIQCLVDEIQFNEFGLRVPKGYYGCYEEEEYGKWWVKPKYIKKVISSSSKASRGGGFEFL